MATPLRDGVYEQLVTRLLQGQIDASAPALFDVAPVPDGDLPTWLTGHLAAEIHRVLRDGRKPETQIAIAHHLLHQLGTAPYPASAEVIEGARLVDDPQRPGAASLLKAVYRAVVPERPTTPLPDRSGW